MERVVELSARVEDLQFQLSTAEGALAETRERAGQAEVRPLASGELHLVTFDPSHHPGSGDVTGG